MEQPDGDMLYMVGEGPKDSLIVWRPEGLSPAEETASAKAPRQSVFGLLEKQEESWCSREQSEGGGRAVEVRSGS